MIFTEKLEQMLVNITLGRKKPENLNDEESETWDKLSSEVAEIKAKGGIIDIPPEIASPETV